MIKHERKKIEYGGFLPLELNPGVEYFARFEDYLFRFNTVKSSLHKIINALGCSRIYIPYYYCPSTTDFLQNENVCVCFYHINEELLPVNVPDEQDSIVLLVDYFGVCGERVKEYSSRFKNAEVVIDFAHDFFEKPILNNHRHNIYSAKKFFGVPDGSYLVSMDIEPDSEALSYASSYSEYLIKTYEEGTNSAYTMKAGVDDYLASNFTRMSCLTVGLLQNVDYSRVKKQREANYKLMKEAFVGIDELLIPDCNAAYQFPLLVRKKGRRIKKELIESKIYVSTLWSGDNLKEHGNEFELRMTNDCVFLPMDQRYDSDDIQYIIETVFEFLNT